MPLCPQITMTAVPVTQSGITMGWVKPIAFANSITAQSLIGTLYAATAPVAYSIGQLWADSAHGNKLYICTQVATIINVTNAAGVVTYTTDATHGLTAGQLISIAEVDPTAYNLTGVTVNTVPTSTTFTVTNAATGAYVDGGWVAGWTLVQDTSIATAQLKADQAWSAVVGKNTVYYAASAPTGTGFTVGDTWFNTASGYQMSNWNGTAWVATPFGTAAIAGGSVDLSKLASGSVDASKLVAGAVTYGKIAAGAVGASEIIANSIVAGNIAAGTITSTQIAAGTILASNIGAGTITGDRLVAGTITATQIAAGYVYAGTINASQINVGTLAAGMTAAGTFYATDIAVSTISATGGCYFYGGLAVASGYNANINGGLYGSTSIYSSPALTGRAMVIASSTDSYQIGTATSSRRYKQDIAPATFDASPLLTLPLQQFRYINEVEAHGKDAKVQTGLMAEDVAAAGLEWLIDRDSLGRPDYIYWSERMPQALLGLVQQLAARVAILERKP